MIGFRVQVPGWPKPVHWPGANWQNCPFGHANGRMPPQDCGFFAAASAPATSISEANANSTESKANLRNMSYPRECMAFRATLRVAWLRGKAKHAGFRISGGQAVAQIAALR